MIRVVGIFLLFVFLIFLFGGVAHANTRDVSEGSEPLENLTVYFFKFFDSIGSFFKNFFAFAENRIKEISSLVNTSFSSSQENLLASIDIATGKIIEDDDRVVSSSERRIEDTPSAQKAVSSVVLEKNNASAPKFKMGTKKSSKLLAIDAGNDEEDDNIENPIKTQVEFNNYDYDESTGGVTTEDLRSSEKAETTWCSFETMILPTHAGVIFNEVAWMGGEKSTREWMELKNVSPKKLALAGYQIIDKDEKIKIDFGDGQIMGENGLFVLERTDDDTLPDIKADFIYKGSLNNENEGIRIFNKNCELIDEVLANPKWPAGDSKTKETMERAFDLSWHASSIVGGTPKKANSQVVSISSSPASTQNTPTTPVVQVNPVTESRVVIKITEIMYDLPGSDAGREWVEVTNAGESAVDFTKLKFFESDTNHNIVGSLGGLTVPANGYAVIADNADKFLTDNPNYEGLLFESSFSLSNTGEAIAIKNGNEILDEINYQKILGAQGDGSSLQLINENWEAGLPTPGKANTASRADTSYGTNLVISEIKTGGVNVGDEFIELYNPFAEDVSLSGWSIQYISGSATSAENAQKKNFEIDNKIPARGFFLVGRGKNQSGGDGYDGLIPPDMTYRGFALSGTANGGIVLLVATTTIVSDINDESIVDFVAYGSVAYAGITITDAPNINGSVERKAWSNGVCLPSENDFKGNGCDSDSGDDFVIRTMPKPQNSLSLREPRNEPSIPSVSASSSLVTYVASSSRLDFAWQDSKSAPETTSIISYELKEEPRTDTSIFYFGTSTIYSVEISESGRDYAFELRAVDADGFHSMPFFASVNVPMTTTTSSGLVTDALGS